MRITAASGTLAALVFVLAAPATAQTRAPLTAEQAVRQSWDGVLNKVLDMAKDFPAYMYEYTFSEGAQSFSEVVWHCVRSARIEAYRLSGRSDAEVRTMAGGLTKPAGKDTMVAAFEEALAESNEALAKNTPVASMIGAIEHVAEQYGKLVGMYRANGMVPPETRKQQERR